MHRNLFKSFYLLLVGELAIICFITRINIKQEHSSNNMVDFLTSANRKKLVDVVRNIGFLLDDTDDLEKNIISTLMDPHLNSYLNSTNKKLHIYKQKLGKNDELLILDAQGFSIASLSIGKKKNNKDNYIKRLHPSEIKRRFPGLTYDIYFKNLNRSLIDAFREDEHELERLSKIYRPSNDQ